MLKKTLLYVNLFVSQACLQKSELCQLSGFDKSASDHKYSTSLFVTFGSFIRHEYYISVINIQSNCLLHLDHPIGMNIIHMSVMNLIGNETRC